ncbi:hypothetical protein JTE90_002176 [Oedothorax gibbosus]|uniref:Uncharacterized protein n=1 Tax=Oedothorax gibbosus TaxID=931172 RepID=A0AAV6VFW2_9ARAC|nr:hypothetical protein JTE90_002176 [Oedothorax gibbosus]
MVTLYKRRGKMGMDPIPLNPFHPRNMIRVKVIQERYKLHESYNCCCNVPYLGYKIMIHFNKGATKTACTNAQDNLTPELSSNRLVYLLPAELHSNPGCALR